MSATISSPSTDPTGRPLSITSVGIDFTASADAVNARGELHIFEGAAFFSSTNCAFSLRSANPLDHLAVFPGRVWGSITCSNLSDPSGSDSSACDLDSATFVFENCDQ